MSKPTQLHVAMFPFFAYGHIIPFVQLSNKLSSHGVKVSFFSAQPNIQRTKSWLNPSVQIIPLEIPQESGLPSGLANTNEVPPIMFGNLMKALYLIQPQIKVQLENLRPHFIFFGFAQSWIPNLASEVGVKSVYFSTFSAFSDAYTAVPSRVEGSKDGNITFDDLKKPPQGFPQWLVDSIKTFQAKDLEIMFKRFDERGPTGYELILKGLSECSLIVSKSSKEMEGPFLDFIQAQFGKPVLVTGPVVLEPKDSVLDEKWSKWLDQYPQKSVIFCSLGSEVYLKEDQIKDLALGLELTNLPFILALNGQVDLDKVLPEGFLKRVKNRGIVNRGWTPQQLILKHPSVGCYVCHSGFSSIMEGMSNGCQLVLLPLKGDQFFNSKLIAHVMKAGVEVHRREEDGFFGKEDILDAVKTLMINVDEEPGKSIRENQAKWREFFTDKDIQKKYISTLVEELKALA